jgi:hypothetical protein
MEKKWAFVIGSRTGAWIKAVCKRNLKKVVSQFMNEGTCSEGDWVVQVS